MEFSENKRLLSASHLIEYWYCPRFIYFMEVLGIRQYEENRLKVRIGRDVHKQKALQHSYLRKKLGVIKIEREVYLSDLQLGICGIIDEILFLDNGSITLLDYKFAYNSHKFKTHFLQDVFYSLLIETRFTIRVDRCYIVYTREKNKLVGYEIKEKDRQQVRRSIDDVHKIISTGYFPKGATSKKQCPDCTYRRLCIQ